MAHDPGKGILGNYMENFMNNFVNCRDYEILHIKDTEPAFDPYKTIMHQRINWYYKSACSKPLLSKEPMHWHGGHSQVDGQTDEDSSQFLIHLRRTDYHICLQDKNQRTALPWNKRDVDEKWDDQKRIVEEEYFVGGIKRTAVVSFLLIWSQYRSFRER